jgi:hypothetical protein
MIINIPKVPLQIDARYVTLVLDTIRDAFQQVNSRRYAQDRLLLRSPDGTVYELTVDNSGVVSTAVNDGKSFD